MANLHETDKYRVRSAIRLFRRMIKFGVFNATDVAASATVKALRDLVRNSTLLHVEHTYSRRAAVEAIYEMEKLAILTNDNVNSLSGGAAHTDLLALLTAEVDGVDEPATDDGGEAYTGNSLYNEASIL